MHSLLFFSSYACQTRGDAQYDKTLEDNVMEQAYWVVQAGLLTPLTFSPASIKSLGCFYPFPPVRAFFSVEGGDSKSANFTLPTLKAFLEARSHNVSGRMCRAIGCPKTLPPPPPPPPRNRHFLVSKKTTQRHFFPIFHLLSQVIFATTTVGGILYCFAILGFNFHCYTQREATPTQKSGPSCVQNIIFRLICIM